MSQPFFSVVIPTFNRSELFPLAVRSILNQTFEDFEIIVSDNCSADSTPEVAKQITDPRVQYVRTPQHYTIADAWEFARLRARGRLIIMLSDDDALVRTALACFYEESERHGADFIFSKVAEYRDQSFPGPDRNTVACPRFSGKSCLVSIEEFVGPLFAFQQRFNMHPSAFAFSRAIADLVAQRTGRFFWTNGVEYSAWPITALFAKRMVYVDLPLTICGRTGKSWGSNIALCNPGEEQIEKLIKDVDHERKHAPLNNFTMCNLIAEGMLTAKSLFPRELARYEFDEVNYLRKTVAELRKRQSMGVNVSAEIEDAMQYANKYPALIDELKAAAGVNGSTAKIPLPSRLRSAIGDLGGGVVRRRIQAYRFAQKLKRGAPTSSFRVFGDDFGFGNIIECAEFLTTKVIRNSYKEAEYRVSIPVGRTGERPATAPGEHD